MTRSVAAIQTELSTARDESRVLSRRIRALEDEMKQAKLVEAENNPHPWLGKKVRRTVTHGWRRNTKTEQGILRVKQPGERFRASSAGVGDLVVVTTSGKTAYDFPARSGEGQWELAQ